MSRSIILAPNNRYVLRGGLSAETPQRFAGFQDDSDDLNYTVDMTAYLDGEIIVGVTREPDGVEISEQTQTHTQFTQRLRNFGSVKISVLTSGGATEQFTIVIKPRAEGKAYVMVSAAITDGDKGDIIVSGGGSSWAIDPSVLTAFGRTLVDDVDAAGARATLGLTATATNTAAQFFDNVASVNSATIASSTNTIMTAGYYAAGDQGGALYVRHVGNVPQSSGINTVYIVSNSGTVYWKLVSINEVHVNQLGAKGDKIKDDTSAIVAAITEAYDSGLLVVALGRGDYRITSSIFLGNGAEGQESTIHHGLRIVGRNTPSVVGLSGVDQQNKGSRIFYDGNANNQACVLGLSGPITRITIENLQLDANNLAGLGLIVTQAAHCTFYRVFVHNYTRWGIYMATRSNVGGVSYACGNNRFEECSTWFPRGTSASGLFLGTGVAGGNDLAGPVTVTRNTFLDSVISYDGTNTSSCGIELEGASGNIFTNVYLNNANSGTGASIKFSPRSAGGIAVFPYENIFYYVEALQDISGTSGIYGNTLHWAAGDAQPIPNLANVRVIVSDGRKWQGTQRAREVRQSVQDTTTTQTTNATTNYVDTELSVTLTCRDTNSLLMVATSGRIKKATGGDAIVTVRINGTDIGETEQKTTSTLDEQNYAIITQAPSVTGTNTVTVRIKSSDANTATHLRGALLVQELY